MRGVTREAIPGPREDEYTVKLNEVLPDDLLIQDVTADEVREAISDANANSAPGPSQQSNKVVRWAWNADPDTIIRLYDGGYG